MNKISVLLALLLLTGAAASTAQPLTQTPTPAPTSAAGMRAVVVSTTNIRSGADTRFPIIGRAAAGDSVMLNGRDASGRWLVIDRSPVDGWIPFFSVQATGDPLTLPVIDASTADEQESGPTAYTYGLINVRAEPTISADVVGQLEMGMTVRINGRNAESNDWLLIASGEDEDDALTGWVAYFTVRVSGSLDVVPILGADLDGQIIVPADQIAQALFNIRLRAEPSIDAETLLVVPFGAEVAPIARSADDAWIYFGYEGAFGWGALNLFRIDADALTALPVYDAALSAAATDQPDQPAAAATDAP